MHKHTGRAAGDGPALRVARHGKCHYSSYRHRIYALEFPGGGAPRHRSGPTSPGRGQEARRVQYTEWTPAKKPSPTRFTRHTCEVEEGYPGASSSTVYSALRVSRVSHRLGISWRSYSSEVVDWPSVGGATHCSGYIAGYFLEK